MSQCIEGVLEIDNERGVIYFHATDGKLAYMTVFRICSLPKPIPIVECGKVEQLDITFGVGTSWGKDSANIPTTT